MSDGKTHRKYHDMGWFIIIPLSLILAIMFPVFVPKFNPILFVVFFNLLFLTGNVIEPDNDLLSLSTSDGIMLSLKHLTGFFVFDFVLGFIGLLLIIWSLIYAYFIGWVGSHRSIFSHGHIIGTAIRAIWWNIPVVLMMREIALYYSFKDYYFEFYADIWLNAYLLGFLALLISDEIHLVLDTTWFKKNVYDSTKHNKANNYNLDTEKETISDGN